MNFVRTYVCSKMFKLQNCPTDGISCLRFAPSSDTLAVSSWDSVSLVSFLK